MPTNEKNKKVAKKDETKNEGSKTKAISGKTKSNPISNFLKSKFSKNVEKSQSAKFAIAADITAEEVKTSSIVTDAVKQLGWGKTLVLAVQHIFAMFGATVLVPLLTGLNVSVTLFCAGIATLWFHFITKGKVPVFLGSSFAFLGAFAAVSGGDPTKLPYATFGVVCAGFVYVILAILIYIFGVKKVMRLFPPVVTGPVIVLIGIILAPSALSNCLANTGYYLNGVKVASGIGSSEALAAIEQGAVYQPRFLISIVAIALIIVCNIWGKKMVKVLPVLIGVVGSYIVALILGWVDYSGLVGAKIIELPPFKETFPIPNFEAAITFMVVSLAAVVEHLGDIAAISATCEKNYMKDPGLTRTLLGDGLGTSIAGVLGGPANTTYGENTGVIALTGVRDPFVIRLAAIGAILLSIFPVVDKFINSIPSEVIGGISFILYGMIAAVGLRNLVENHVDFSKSRNVIVAAIIMVSGLAFNSTPINIKISTITLQFGGIACAAIFGIILNAILPYKDYEFKE